MNPRRQQQTLETVTFVTIASTQESNERAINRSPLPFLSREGYKETRELGHALKSFGTDFDYVFIAAPLLMYSAVAEMAIAITGAEGTGYADLPVSGFELAVREYDPVERIQALGNRSLGHVLSDPANADFLRSYAKLRHGRILYDTRMKKVKHGIVFCFPVLGQAIARTFVRKREERRRIEDITLLPGHALQIDVATGSLRIPSEESVAMLANYPK